MPDDNTLRVAAIGASAGGLDAFRTLLSALPADTGMAFILVQHLDPAHASMMVSLLAGYTSMGMVEAGDGMRIEPNKVYVIPPGRYLSVADSKLHLSPVGGGRARMPFDFLLESLAGAYGSHAICAILTGTGSDGGVGAQSIREKGGLVIAQDPEEAQFDGMPRSAIAAGVVDFILPMTRIPEALVHFAKQGVVPFGSRRGPFPSGSAFARILALLRTQTAHDFDLHKRGTLMRRIERRMSLARITDPEQYLVLLQKEPAEARNLVDDLFINVTRFFRDTAAFDLLASQIISDLVSKQPYNQPIRAWVAGCSTGEEAYSIAMVFSEAIAASKRSIKLTVFASDIDEDAIAFARDGLYPAAIEADVSPARLARFFVKEDQGYRVSRALRDAVVFSVHDLLTDAPFSRIDFISCCNVLIYLRHEVQQQVLGLFHFALREGGILFLGSAGSIGEAGDRFEAISQKDRIYLHIGRAHPGEVELPIGRGEAVRSLIPRTVRPLPVRRPGINELAQRMLLETFAPASSLVNLRNEGVYYFGPVDRYLRVPEGEANQNILAAARDGLRSAVRAAIEKATRERARAVIGGAQLQRNGETAAVTVSATPMGSNGERWLLVSFVDEPRQPETPASTTVPPSTGEAARIAGLERELDAARKDFDDAARDREIAEEELKAVNEEAMSLNEEFQTTNEELQTSKEELQSLNEELTTLNVQLQETVNREHATADDLQNILTSSDVGTLFLDEDLKIRFFSSAAKRLFNLIPSDIGRPLADLARNFTDDDLIADAHAVLAKLAPISRDVPAATGFWYMRRILPYRTHENQIKGVVITFVDVTDIKVVERAAASARAYTESLVGEIRGPLLVLDEDLLVVSGSRPFYRLFDTDPARTIGRSLATLDAGCLDVPELEKFLDLARTDSAAVEDYEMEVDLPTLGRRILVFNTMDIPQEAGAKRKILLAIDDITARKQAQAALVDARQIADAANTSKSRFLAAASHDLRQPLQTLHLLQGVLSRKVADKEGSDLVAGIGDTLTAMTGMMDTLLDISQIEAGIATPEITSFPVGDLLRRLQSEFAHSTPARGLAWRVVPCRLTVRSDQRLLEQMLRNLLNNAVKYTEKGKILLGCRRRGGSLRIEVWDTGIGIPEESLKAIFEEFHQLANPARRLSLGLGLGLAIVQRLGSLLGHTIDVRSRPGHGSVFAVTVPTAPAEGSVEARAVAPSGDKTATARAAILIVEDDPAVRNSLAALLQTEGYRTAGAADGREALALAAGRRFVPDLAIVDYNLPDGRNGGELAAPLRAALGNELPILVLTGDMSSATQQDVARQGHLLVHKPIQPAELLRLLATLLDARSRS
jgi:two-component system, chemotaxis family, CheB/CheR fusion protein